MGPFYREIEQGPLDKRKKALAHLQALPIQTRRVKIAIQKLKALQGSYPQPEFPYHGPRLFDVPVLVSLCKRIHNEASYLLLRGKPPCHYWSR